MRRVLDPLRDFLKAEAAGGVVLAAAAALALVWVNSPVGDSYVNLWATELTIGSDGWALSKDLQHWVNDGLMAIFFFVVGLEIKRELVVGELRDPRAAVLPAVAAVGGVVVPAAIYLAFTWGTEAAGGWGIPMATDIAFAVGVLALLGSRVPAGVKLFLLSVAIIDDIIAISVIALFYTDDLRPLWLLGAAAGLGFVVLLRVLGVTRIWPYVLVGAGVWLCTLESGVHATIAGVALGLLTPTGRVGGREVLNEIEHRLHPWSAFLVIPLFALANAGVQISTEALRQAATSPAALGIISGLVLGKLFGIAGAAWAMLRLGWGVLPSGMQPAHVWGVAALAGIGFTVSLFIADLAFAGSALSDEVKLGIFAGSAVAGVLGAVLLRGVDRSRADLPR